MPEIARFLARAWASACQPPCFSDRGSACAQSAGSDLRDRVAAEHVAEGLFGRGVRAAVQHQTWHAGFTQHADFGVVESLALGDLAEFCEQSRREASAQKLELALAGAQRKKLIGAA